MKKTHPIASRKLMTKVKSSKKDPMECFCRIRPIEVGIQHSCIRVKDENTVVLFPLDASQSTKSTQEIHCSFQHVFDDTITHKQLFDQVGLPLVKDLLQGCNGLLFAYGTTSSGKTYTMTGTPQDGGLLPRCLDVIFNSIKDFQTHKFVFKPDKLNSFDMQSTSEVFFDQQKELGMTKNKIRNKKEVITNWHSRVPDNGIIEDIPDACFSIFVSYVEIYNNLIYDLFDDTSVNVKKRKNQNLKTLREDASHNVYVFGASEIEVKTVEEALELFYKGQLRCRVSQTSLNIESSRSHKIFSIRVVQAPLDLYRKEVLQPKDKITISQLSLVDLAGSERSFRSKSTGLKLQEAGNINNSLMTLRHCIEALRESQNEGVIKIIPYRETKLTYLFKTFFEGEGKIRMIVCINPNADYYDEIVHVMQFAEKTQAVLISRPTPVSAPSKSDPRLLCNKTPINMAKEQKVSAEWSPTISSLGRDIAELIMENVDDVNIRIKLVDSLLARITQRNTSLKNSNQQRDDFRKNILVLLKENCKIKERTPLPTKEQVKHLKEKLSSTNLAVNVLQKLADEYKRQADECMKKADELQKQVDKYRKQANEYEKQADEYKKQIDEYEKQIDKYRQQDNRASTESLKLVTENIKKSAIERTELSGKAFFPKIRPALDSVHHNNETNVQLSCHSCQKVEKLHQVSEPLVYQLKKQNDDNLSKKELEHKCSLCRVPWTSLQYYKSEVSNTD